MPAPIEYGKSQRWYNNHCAFCGKLMKDTEPRVKGHAIFKNDIEVNIICHEKCVKDAEMQEAIKQTKEMGKK